MFNLFAGPAFTRADAVRLRRIERKLDLILTHLGIPYEEDNALPAPIRELADGGDKIGAIRLLREQTGVGLAEAKRVIDEYLAGRAG